MTSNIFSEINAPSERVRAYEKQPKQTAVKLENVLPASTMSAEDKVDISETNQPKKEKKGIIKSVKTFIANIKKFFASIGSYTKGALKGIAQGAVAGSLVFTAGHIANCFKTKGAEAGQKIRKIPNKALAIGAAVIALGVNIWTASLNASEKKSDIDHRWTGHNN